MNKSRRKHSAAFKAEVALAAIKERETLSELSARYGIHPTVISTWKNEFLKRSEELFSKGGSPKADFEKERRELYAKIGELKMQRDWLKKVETVGLGIMERRDPVSTDDRLSLQSQCDLLGISKSGLYYVSKGESKDYGENG